jgi:shikimate dehydrogenase
MRELPGRLVLLGHPVAHSLSPTFQNAALQAARIPLQYEAMDVADVTRLFEVIREERWAGNITIPHKEVAARHCDELTPIAKRVDAVNSFRVDEGRVTGHNTDVDGVAAAVAKLLGATPTNRLIGIVGAGGSAAAVLAAVERWPGCQALVANRGAARLDALTERFSSVARKSDVGEITAQADLVINATSLGLRDDDPLPVSPDALRATCAVLDLVYAPHRTRLVREARGQGLRAEDGLSMLVAQGAAAFEWWFGVAPDRDVMWRSLQGIVD